MKQDRQTSQEHGRNAKASLIKAVDAIDKYAEVRWIGTDSSRLDAFFDYLFGLIEADEVKAQGREYPAGHE